MDHYLAITIGPITKTMQIAQKTREFWAASMLFSILSKYLCEALKKQGIKEEDFFLPSKKNFSRQMQNIGLYADRIICKANETILKIFEEKRFDEDVLTIVFNNLTKEVKDLLNIAALDTETLKSYFKIYAVIKTVDDNEEIAKDLFNRLDVLELYNTGSSNNSSQKNLKTFFENVNTRYEEENELDEQKKVISNSFIKTYTDNTLKDLNDNKRIPSIVEISTKPLVKKDDKQAQKIYKQILNRNIWKKTPNENKLFEALKTSFPDSLKNHHRYIAILQADGDKLGSHLTTLTNTAIFVDIQDALYDWGDKALSVLQAYGALPIYIGGDDLMCFAPVNNGNKTILELAKEINDAYNNNATLKTAKSTLSIAIKIAYYKAPMGESYEETFPLLKEVAKQHVYNNKEANSCAISYDKHSGQPHRFVFDFNDEYNTYIKPIISNMITGVDKRSFINSVFYKIRANEQLLWLASKGSSDRLWYFFENNFEEAKPKRKGTKSYQFLEAICKYLHYLFDTWKDSKMDQQNQEMKATNHLYSALKIFRFIKGLDYDN